MNCPKCKESLSTSAMSLHDILPEALEVRVACNCGADYFQFIPNECWSQSENTELHNLGTK